MWRPAYISLIGLYRRRWIRAVGDEGGENEGEEEKEEEEDEEEEEEEEEEEGEEEEVEEEEVARLRGFTYAVVSL